MWSGSGIQEAPLQVYYGALVFAPQQSIVRHQYGQEMPAGVQVKSGLDEDWGPLLQTLEGHESHVTSVAFSAAGDRLASASLDGMVRVWDAKTGQPLHTLEAQASLVIGLSFSGHQLFSVLKDMKMRVWDARNGQQQLPLFASCLYSVTSGDFSAVGDRLALASEDRIVRVWDTETRELLHTLEGHEDRVTSVAFSAVGDRLASASLDKTVRVWDTKTKELLHTLEGHEDRVTSVAFSAAGDRLASASWDKTVRVWDTKTKELLHTLEGHEDRVTSVAFSAVGDRLASASGDKTVRVWDAEKGGLLHTLEGHEDRVTSVAFPAAGDRLASASWDKTVRVWNAKTKQLLHTLEVRHWIMHVAFSRDGAHVETDRGSIQLPSPAFNTIASRQHPRERIIVKDRWLAVNSEDTLWLPANYIRSCVAIQGSLVALGSSSGMILLDLSY
jgi:WD40 repeat protein